MGLFSKTGKLLVLGLDNAGKSTLLTLLVRDEVVPHAPTHQPVTDVISVGAMKMRAVDMGGHEIARRMWEQYSHDADGIVYIVDAVDRERFQEAGLALHKLLLTLAVSTPVLVLGNKDDLQGAAREARPVERGVGLPTARRQPRPPPFAWRFAVPPAGRPDPPTDRPLPTLTAFLPCRAGGGAVLQPGTRRDPAAPQVERRRPPRQARPWRVWRLRSGGSSPAPHHDRSEASEEGR